MIFYLAKGNIGTLGINVFSKPPIKIFRVSDASVCWSGSGDRLKGIEGELIACFHALEKFIPTLKMPQASCMKVEVIDEVEGASIEVLDRNVDCEVSYH